MLLHMEALAGAGRAAEALRAARSYRQRLVEQTGLDPSAALTARERSIAAGPAHGGAVAVGAAPRIAAARSTMFGRDGEVSGVVRLLRTERLVTLVGPGGVGKTTVAMEAARRDGVGREITIVHLAAVTEPSSVLTDDLDRRRPARRRRRPVDRARRGAGQPPVAARDRQLRTPAARGPQRGRRAHQRVPRPHDPGDQSGAPGPAVRADLTVGTPAPAGRRATRRPRHRPVGGPVRGARARVQPDLALEQGDLALVAAVVRRLDGMPLAIELAAGRLSSIGIGDLTRRLDRALDVLAAAARGRRAPRARCAPPSNGRTTCSRRRNDGSSAPWPCSPTASTSRPPSRSSTTSRPPSRRPPRSPTSSTPRCSSPASPTVPATGCSTRCAPSASTACAPPASTTTPSSGC